MSDEESCRKCRFYRAESDVHGWCLRYAPRPIVVRVPGYETEYGDALWPFVNPDDWCGEFSEPNTEASRDEGGAKS